VIKHGMGYGLTGLDWVGLGWTRAGFAVVIRLLTGERRGKVLRPAGTCIAFNRYQTLACLATFQRRFATCFRLRAVLARSAAAGNVVATGCRHPERSRYYGYGMIQFHHGKRGEACGR